MTATAEVVFLLDVDNTLLNNDRVIADMQSHLAGTLGPECERRYSSKQSLSLMLPSTLISSKLSAWPT